MTTTAAASLSSQRRGFARFVDGSYHGPFLSRNHLRWGCHPFYSWLLGSWLLGSRLLAAFPGTSSAGSSDSHPSQWLFHSPTTLTRLLTCWLIFFQRRLWWRATRKPRSSSRTRTSCRSSILEKLILEFYLYSYGTIYICTIESTFYFD